MNYERSGGEKKIDIFCVQPNDKCVWQKNMVVGGSIVPKESKRKT
jgi:hypothetical protein